MVGWIGIIRQPSYVVLRIPQWISQVWLPGIGGCEWQLGWGEALPTRFQRPSALDALLSAGAMGSNKSPSWQGRKDLLMWVDVHSSSWCDHTHSSIRNIIVMFPCFSSRCPGEGRGGAALQVRRGCWIVFRGSPQTSMVFSIESEFDWDWWEFKPANMGIQSSYEPSFWVGHFGCITVVLSVNLPLSVV